MISAQSDSVVQERLIEKYMSLPNHVWDNIIKDATKVWQKLCGDESLFSAETCTKFYVLERCRTYC